MTSRTLGLTLVTLAAWAACSASAFAGHYFYSTPPPNGWYSGTPPRIAHMHDHNWIDNRVPFWNRVDNDGPQWTSANDARIDWEARTIVDLTPTGSHLEARIQLDDWWYGDTNWAGLMEPFAWHRDGDPYSPETHAPVNTIWDDAGHMSQAHTHVNLTFMHSSIEGYNARRNLACHEIGHALSLWHQGGTSCMQSQVRRELAFRIPDAHDVAMVNQLYTSWGH
jgi:hypothetical protein